MAKDKTIIALEKIRKALLKNREEEVEGRVYDPAKQVEGYEKRIEGSGIDVKKAKDKRNFIEKALNLPEKQNVIFDFFEILNRPQQALFGGIKAAQEGEDFFKGAEEGIRGRRRTQFKEILNEAGITEETEGTIGVDDALGLVGDIFLDPMNIATFGTGKAAQLAKLTKQLQTLDKVQDVKKIGEVTAEIARVSRMSSRISGSGLAMKGVAKGFKGAFKLGDKGLSKLLKYVDNNYIKNLAKTKGITVEAAAKLRKVGALSGYVSIKDSIRKTFNAVAALPAGLMEKVRKTRGSQGVAHSKTLIRLQKKYKNIDDAVDVIVKTYNSKYADALTKDDVYQFLTTLHENGNQVFKNGALTREGINRNTTLKAMLHDRNAMNVTGLHQVDAERIDDFLKTYYKPWYDKNVTEDNPLFLVQPGRNGTEASYRFRNEELWENISKKVNNTSDADILSKASTLTEEQEKFITTFNDAIDKYESATGVSALREGSEAYKKYAGNTEVIESLSERTSKITEDLKKYAGKTDEVSQAKVKELLKKRKALGKAQRKLMANNKIILSENAEEIQKLLAEVQESKMQYLREQGISDIDIMGEHAKKALEEEFTARHFFTEEKVKQLEKFSQEEGVVEVLDEIYYFMDDAINMINDTMGAGIVHTNGYLAHAVTPEWHDLQMDKYMKQHAKDKVWSSTRELLGDAQAMGKRRYNMSVFEANEISKSYIQHLMDTTPNMAEEVKEKLMSKMNLDIFAKDLETSFVDFIGKSTKAAGDSLILHHVVESSFITSSGEFNPDYIREAAPGMTRPRGFVEIKKEALKRKLEGMSIYIKGNELNKDMIKKVMGAVEGVTEHSLYMDKNMHQLIGRIADKEETSGLMRAMDFLTNMFKKNKLLSPGFQMRNIAGNLSNMSLSGMPMKDIMKYNVKAHNMLKTGESIFQKIAEGVLDVSQLSAKDAANYAIYSEFLSHGFAELGNALHDIPEELWNVHRKISTYGAADAPVKELNRQIRIAQKAGDFGEVAKLKETLKAAKKVAFPDKVKGFPAHAYDTLISLNMRGNQAQDINFRAALYMYAKDNPQFLFDNGYDSAQDAVRKILFDYLDLSVNERDVMRKIIPFYTFTKKNLAFQIQNMQKNTHRYARFIKAANSTWGMLDLKPEELDRFKIENFWIPIPHIGKDGKYRAIKTSLPLGDLGEWLDDPLKRALSSTSPILRAPAELATNRQIFSGMPIQEFKGQKGYVIPEVGRKTEFGLSQLGLDVPVAQAMDIGRTGVNLLKGETQSVGQALEGMVGRTVYSTIDPASTASRNAYNELDDMQNLMRYYKQQGIDIFTLAELENQSKLKGVKGTIERLRAINQRK